MDKNQLTTGIKGYYALKNFNITGGFMDELVGLDSDFERIKIPAGGGTMFEIPSENLNEPDSAKEFSAVIIHHHPLYSYYQTKYTGATTPPDCSSFDSITGEGNPGGNCATCGFNKFGSGENGSKACKTKHRLYLLREGELFPLILLLPASSKKEYSRYVKRLLQAGKKTDSVVTKFSLKKAVNSGGIAFSQVQFGVDRSLHEDEILLIRKISEQIKLCAKDISQKSHGVAINEATGEVIEEEIL